MAREEKSFLSLFLLAEGTIKWCRGAFAPKYLEKTEIYRAPRGAVLDADDLIL
jgi:hypothetical protein